MRAESLVQGSRHRPLIIRGGLARTFGSLVAFLALLFLLGGFYLLVDAFEHPLDAAAVGVLAAAFSITLAVILLYYLFKPRHRKGARRVRVKRVFGQENIAPREFSGDGVRGLR